MFKGSARFFCSGLEKLIKRHEELERQAGETGSAGLSKAAQRIKREIDALKKINGDGVRTHRNDESMLVFPKKR